MKVKFLLTIIFIVTVFISCNKEYVPSNKYKDFTINGILYYKQPLANQEIGLYNGDKLVKTIKTDSNGYFSFKLSDYSTIYKLKYKNISAVFKPYDNEFISLTPLSSLIEYMDYSIEDSIYYLGYVFGIDVLHTNPANSNFYGSLIYVLNNTALQNSISFDDAVYDLQQEIKDGIFGNDYTTFIASLKTNLKDIGYTSKFINSEDNIVDFNNIDKTIISTPINYLNMMKDNFTNKFSTTSDEINRAFSYASNYYKNFYNLAKIDYFTSFISYDVLNNISNSQIPFEDRNLTLTLSTLDNSFYKYKISDGDNNILEGNLTIKDQNDTYFKADIVDNDLNTTLIANITDKNLTINLKEVNLSNMDISYFVSDAFFDDNDSILFMKFNKLETYSNYNGFKFRGSIKFMKYSEKSDNNYIFKNGYFYNNGVYPKKIVLEGNFYLAEFDKIFQNGVIILRNFANNFSELGDTNNYIIYGYSNYNYSNLNNFFISDSVLEVSFYDNNQVLDMLFDKNRVEFISSYPYYFNIPLNPTPKFSNQPIYFNFKYLDSFK